MKKLFIYMIALAPVVVVAQVNRTHAPKPGPAPEIKIGTPASFTLPNGLRVFVVQNTKLPRVSASLTFDMEGIVEGEKAGLTDMAGSLIRRGTTKMNKEKLDEEVDFLGANLNTTATGVSASSLSKNFPKIFSMMSDVVLRPSYPASELDKIRKQELSGLQSAKDDPSAISTNVSNRLVYGKNHPYGDIETEKTVGNVKMQDIKSYFATYWKPNNAFLVFVGDITPATAKALTTKYFGAWKKGVVPKRTYKTPELPAKTYIAIVDRPASVQSLINFIAPIEMRPGTTDVIPTSVMNELLGGSSTAKLFMNLREKHGFTYGAYSRVKPDRLVGSFTASASVRNEKTDSAVSEFINEFNTIREESITDTTLLNIKSNMTGSFARSLENPATIARFALDVARYKMPADYYQNYLKNLGDVTSENVISMAGKYVTPKQMHIIIVGNAKQIAEGLDKYGEVKYFDVYGNEIAPPAAAKKVDAGVTAESILQKAVAAVGTPEAMSAVKDVVMTGEASIQGQAISVSRKYILNSAFAMEMSMSGMVMMKQMMKDGKYSMTAQGAEQEVDAEGKERINEEASFFGDAYMLKQTGNTYTLNGIEKVNDKDAYALQIKTAGGREKTNYYDVASGLKVKSTATQKSPMGEATVQTYYSDYQNINGIQIPTTITVDYGPIKFDMKFKDVKVNSGLKAEDIK